MGVGSCPSCGALVPSAAQGTATSVSGRNLRPVSDREEKAVPAVRVNDVLSGRYRLVEKVGEGGMGTVYVARDLELDRQVAVKLLASNLVHDEDVVVRFEREARLTAALDHPNIVPVYDVGRVDARPYIVMKLLQGDTLAAVLREKGGLTSDETQSLLRQLASGLDYLHAKGFIHRDIKAGNIFVGPGGLATILDFGILRSKSGSEGLTRTGMVMGTPHYMAPEQALGLKDVDHRVDLYALGVVLFECLTGTLPFEADSELRLIQMQAHAPPPDIIDRAPWISRPVADVVRKALAKSPTDRFDSGAELARALENAYRTSKGHPAAPPRPSVSPAVPEVGSSTSPSLRKLAGSETPPPVVMGVALTPLTPPRATPPLATPPARPRRWLILGVVVALAGLGLGAWRWTASDEVPLPPLAQAVDSGPAAVAAEGPDAGAELEAALALTEPDGGWDEAPSDAGLGSMAVVSVLEHAADADPDPADLDVSKHPRVRVRKSGRVNIITTHAGDSYWAQVSIDGVPRGRTPLLLDLPVGSHQVRVERSGFKAQAREIRVASGKPTVVRIDLIP